MASLAALAGHPGVFGRGPLHLLAVSYLAAMTFGMVSRVSLGHSGRALEADSVTWYGFLALVAVGVTRALADLAALPAGARSALLGLAALAWILEPAWFTTHVVPTPRLTEDLRWIDAESSRPLMLEAVDLDRDAIFADFYGCIGSREADG